MDIVGGSAAAACLGNKQSGFIEIIFSRLQSVNKLSDYKLSRIANIIVDIFQTCVNNFMAGTRQQFNIISIQY